MEILRTLWELIAGLTVLGWDLAVLLVSSTGHLLYHLHTDAPRLEGLLVGVLLAWLMVHRDKHPLLRVVSSPLKLVVDILDLAWEQATEVIGDMWDVAVKWFGGAASWVRGKLVAGWSWMMSGLAGLKGRLSK
jgi:hypothetical protein